MLIFAIDDERPSLNAAKRIISEACPDAEIMAYKDACEALKTIAEDGIKPDVAFCDIEMPGVNGLEFAVQMKNVSPDTKIVFVTGYLKYAIDAFKVHVHGYIMKPLTVEAVLEELDAIPDISSPELERLNIRCFGHFEVFWHGEPLLFQRKKTKEMLAFLIDREGASCTVAEIAGALWEENPDSKTAGQRVRNLIYDLRSTLHEIGMENVLIRDRHQIAIRRDMIDCDYYKMLAGDMAWVNAYKGEYMVDYSWAELTAGKLYFRNDKK